MLKNLQPEAYYLGFDIGGTKCSIVLGDKDFNIYEKVFFKTNVERGYEAILEEFKEHVKSIFVTHDQKKLVKIGISCGGP